MAFLMIGRDVMLDSRINKVSVQPLGSGTYALRINNRKASYEGTKEACETLRERVVEYLMAEHNLLLIDMNEDLLENDGPDWQPL